MMRKGEERTHFQRKKKNQKSNSPKNKKNPFSPNQKKIKFISLQYESISLFKPKSITPFLFSSKWGDFKLSN